MAAPELTLAIRDLDAGGKSLTYTLRAPWIRGALEDTGATAGQHDGSLTLRASKSGPDVALRGTLAAELEVPCSRCLEPARVVVHEDLAALAVPRASSQSMDTRGEGADGAADDADVIAYDGDSVTLDDWIRDELLLAIPMIPLCSEACEGIRP